jgi:hypothetical protein
MGDGSHDYRLLKLFSQVRFPGELIGTLDEFE